jgi:hypothetical protein
MLNIRGYSFFPTPYRLQKSTPSFSGSINEIAKFAYFKTLVVPLFKHQRKMHENFINNITQQNNIISQKFFAQSILAC